MILEALVTTLDADGGPQLVDGQVDLAYETETGWVVVDFKTDIEIASAQDAYKQQVALYCEAVTKATGMLETSNLTTKGCSTPGGN